MNSLTSLGLLTKPQKLGLMPSNSLGFADMCGQLAPLNFQKGTLFNGVNFARQTAQINQTDQTHLTHQTNQTNQTNQTGQTGAPKSS
ncbi:MAG: hypothetical protein DRH43_09500 [Deltaproteobacteria bacterium]|nr:MAG: hypothetical protein DRH43_09500 [Deltaproteobacteria bacterium]